MLHHLTKITLRIFDNVYVTLFTVQYFDKFTLPLFDKIILRYNVSAACLMYEHFVLFSILNHL